jgi:ribonuclease P protein component
MRTNEFRKVERITSQKLIDELFGGGRSKSFAAFPIRAVWSLRQRGAHDVPVQVLVSVPKKRLHHAVDRNRTKRQMREAYRLSKQPLLAVLPAEQSLAIALIWQSDRLESSSLIATRMAKLISRICESL